MGKDRTIKGQRNGETIHLKKLFGGKTAEQVHREVALKGRKCECGIPASFRVVSFAPVDELMKRSPALLLQLGRENNGNIPIVETKHGKHVKIGECYGCDICRTSIEKAAAKGPSWVIVDFQNGPTKTVPLIQVGGSPEGSP